MPGTPVHHEVSQVPPDVLSDAGVPEATRGTPQFRNGTLMDSPAERYILIPFPRAPLPAELQPAYTRLPVSPPDA